MFIQYIDMSCNYEFISIFFCFNHKIKDTGMKWNEGETKRHIKKQ